MRRGGLRRRGSRYLIAAVAQLPDQVEQLKNLGVHAAYNTYAAAGAGFAAHVHMELRDELQDFGILRPPSGSAE